MQLKDIRPKLASGGLSSRPQPTVEPLPEIPGYTQEQLLALPPEDLKKLLELYSKDTERIA